MFIHWFDQCMACIIMLPKCISISGTYDKKKENILNLNYFYSRQRSEQEERLVSTNKKQRQFVKANTGSESEKASLRIPKPACSVDRMEASSWQLSAEKQRHQEEGPHGRPCRHACQQSEGNVLHQTVKWVPLNNYLVGTLETDEDGKSLNVFFFIIIIVNVYVKTNKNLLCLLWVNVAALRSDQIPEGRMVI